MNVDAVLSYHTNPYTCGVAKWNHRLARELGVPMLTLDKHPVSHPLISIKTSEIPSSVQWALIASWYRHYSLFFHDNPHGLAADSVIKRADVVYAANSEIAKHLKAREISGVIEAWCPSTIETPPPRANLTILTFGMAHKLVSPHYQKLKALLDAHGEPYTILVSTGVHEGTPWDAALEGAATTLRGLFGADHVELLGYLSDAALDREIRAATACAAFYDPALRANNTTAWAVLERDRPLITNMDEDSPGCDALDIAMLSDWPVPRSSAFDWDVPSWSDLLHVMRAEMPCAS